MIVAMAHFRAGYSASKLSVVPSLIRHAHQIPCHATNRTFSKYPKVLSFPTSKLDVVHRKASLDAQKYFSMSAQYSHTTTLSRQQVTILSDMEAIVSECPNKSDAYW